VEVQHRNVDEGVGCLRACLLCPLQEEQCSYVIEHLGTSQGVVFIDNLGLHKKGAFRTALADLDKSRSIL
jgi:hypothetical protein